MYTVYVRGQASLRAHQGQAARTELDHPGVVGSSPIGPLSRLGLAKAYTMMGDSAKSRAACQDFFTLWKDAGADLPILGEARKSCRALHPK